MWLKSTLAQRRHDCSLLHANVHNRDVPADVMGATDFSLRESVMIACECDECGSAYKVKDQNAGKKFKCKYCETTVQVPGGAKSNPRNAGGAGQKRRKKAARRQQPEYDDYEDYSADESESYDEYDSYDDGYDDYGDYDDGYDDYEEPRRAPRRAPRSKKKKKRRSSGGGVSFSGAGYAANPLLWIGLPFILAILVGAVSIVSPGGGFLAWVAVAVIAGIISMCCGLHSIVLAFREDVACGLMILFVPFYGLYYLITRWEEQREPFVIQLSMTLAMILPAFGMMLGGE